MKWWKKMIIRFYTIPRSALLARLCDNYFLSYPKCGRTWVRYFLTEYIKKKYDADYNLEFDHIFKKVSAVPRITFTHGKYDDKNLRRFDASLQKFAQRGKRVTMLVRDPRDVIVSHFFHVRKRSRGESVDFDDIHAFIHDDVYGIERIVNYYNLIYQYRNDFGAFHLLSYEGLQADDYNTFKNLLSFLGIAIETEALEYAVEESGFKKMKQAEKKKEVDNFRLKPGDEDDPESYKVRKGEVGGYKEYCSEDDIAFMNTALDDLHPDLKEELKIQTASETGT